MLQANTSTSTIEIKITSGKWNTTIGTTGSFKNSGSITWSAKGDDMSAGDSNSTAIVQANEPENLLSIKLMTLFPDIQNGYVKAYAKAGHVEAVVYTADASDGSKLGDICEAEYDNGTLKGKGNVNWTTKVAKWDEKTAGISSEGLTVGTAPALALGNPGNAPESKP
jgi:type IV pilus assembly protein PilA